MGKQLHYSKLEITFRWEPLIPIFVAVEFACCQQAAAQHGEAADLPKPRRANARERVLKKYNGSPKIDT